MHQQFTLDTETDSTHSTAIADDISEDQPDTIETVLEVLPTPADTKSVTEVEQIAAGLHRGKRLQRRMALYFIGMPLLILPLVLTMRQIQHLGSGGPLNPEHRIAFLHQIFACVALPVIGSLVTLTLLLSTSVARWRIGQRAKRLALGFEGRDGRQTQSRTITTEAVDDLGAIGSLTEMLEIDSIPVRNMAKAKLTQLLPQLKASDAALLSAAQRRRLNLFLGAHRFDLGYRDIRELWSKQARQRDLEFQLAILKAYEQVGDADCLPAVQSLAHPTVHYKLVPPEVVDAAQQCLLFLEPMLAQDRASKQLLRASSASDVLPDTLLRPAMHNTNPEESASLLRATDA